MKTFENAPKMSEHNYAGQFFKIFEIKKKPNIWSYEHMVVGDCSSELDYTRGARVAPESERA